jgi:hypothetical protein
MEGLTAPVEEYDRDDTDSENSVPVDDEEQLLQTVLCDDDGGSETISSDGSKD